MGYWSRWLGRSKETDSFTLPKGFLPQSLRPSHDSRRLGYAVQSGWGFYVAVNGSPRRRYKHVAGFTFSPNSKRFGYAASRPGKRLVVCDEAEYESYDDVGKTSPIFSPNSERVAYTAAVNGRGWFAAVDGQILGGSYEGFGPGGILFSPDSQKVAFVIKDGRSWALIVNGTVQARHPNILQRSLCFSPDSKKLAYVACMAGSNVNGAWVGEASVVVDGVPLQSWPHDERASIGLSNEVYFSPDSKRVAYWVMKDGKASVSVDGNPQKWYDGRVSGWSEGHPGCEILPDYGKLSWRSRSISFSPDGHHYAYAAADGNQHVLVYDGREQKRHEKITNNPIVFSPDSRHLAYFAEENGQQFVVRDWAPMARYHGMSGDGSFSPDSRHFAYVAIDSPGLSSFDRRSDVDMRVLTENRGVRTFIRRDLAGTFLLVIDAHALRMRGGPVTGASLSWNDSESLHTLAAEGRNVMVSDFRIPQRKQM